MIWLVSLGELDRANQYSVITFMLTHILASSASLSRDINSTRSSSSPSPFPPDPEPPVPFRMFQASHAPGRPSRAKMTHTACLAGWSEAKWVEIEKK
jgi:hypothetical protein